MEARDEPSYQFRWAYFGDHHQPGVLRQRAQSIHRISPQHWLPFSSSDIPRSFPPQGFDHPVPSAWVSLSPHFTWLPPSGPSVLNLNAQSPERPSLTLLCRLRMTPLLPCHPRLKFISCLTLTIICNFEYIV